MTKQDKLNKYKFVIEWTYPTGCRTYTNGSNNPTEISYRIKELTKYGIKIDLIKGNFSELNCNVK